MNQNRIPRFARHELNVAGEPTPEARAREASGAPTPGYEERIAERQRYEHYRELDRQRGVVAIDNFIREVNADHTDVISVGRGKACFMRDEIERLRKAEPTGETQQSLGGWCRETFPEFSGITNRAVAMLEEAVELAIEAGLSPEQIRATIEVPIQKEVARGYDRPRTVAGLAEEIADVQINLLSLAEDAGISAQAALDEKMRKNRSRPLDYYRMKNAQKRELGLPLAPIKVDHA